MNKIEKIMAHIALENHTTVEEVRKEIAVAIEMGINNPNPEIQKKWRAMSRTGGVPTPEEAILYLHKEAKKRLK